ncbi:MAG TPA: rhomboid family intramembrane serine protease [Solirubrobacterales bacterium]
MTPTPVGMRCPECWSQGPSVDTNPPAQPSGLWSTPATFVLIAINLIVYLIEVAGSGINDPSTKIFENYALAGPFVAEGEWYRLVTAGFLHLDLLRIILYASTLLLAGRMLEPLLGTLRFTFIYFTSLLAASFGALLLNSNELTVSALGAAFGLLAASVVLTRTRGSHSKEFTTCFAALIAINLIGSFIAADATAGDYLGGVVGGLICAILIVAGDRGKLGSQPRNAELQLMALVAAISVFASIAIA